MYLTKLGACSLLLLLALHGQAPSVHSHKLEPQSELSAPGHAHKDAHWPPSERPQPEVPFKFLVWLRNTVSASVAPVKHWAQLIWRYRQWYASYEALRLTSTGRPMPSARDRLREEYARADREMVADFCAAGRSADAELVAAADGQVDLQAMENNGYLLELLGQVIGRLEEQLEEQKPVEEEEGDLLAADAAPDAQQEEEETASSAEEQREAVDRLKRILLKQAKSVAVNEAFALAKTAVCFAMAQYMVTLPSENLNLLLGLMLGPASQGFAQRYLINSLFRVAYETARYVGPIAYQQCKLLTPGQVKVKTL